MAFDYVNELPEVLGNYPNLDRGQRIIEVGGGLRIVPVRIFRASGLGVAGMSEAVNFPASKCREIQLFNPPFTNDTRDVANTVEVLWGDSIFQIGELAPFQYSDRMPIANSLEVWVRGYFAADNVEYIDVYCFLFI